MLALPAITGAAMSPKNTPTSVLEEQPMTDDQTPLLAIRDLRVWFELRRFGFARAGYVHAVDGVSFDLARGEAIAIVGESGCGKSSLMKTILALYKPTSGSVLFNGQDLGKFNSSGMHQYYSHVGYVQQDPYGALAPFMSVKRILEEPLIVGGIKNSAIREDRIRKVMEEVKLFPINDFLEKYPHMLSGGQQQRVVIARAMMMEPQLLVADEPVSMLDASVRIEILKLLRNLQQKHNLTVIYITHDLSTVSYFAERIFVMYAGQVIEKASVDELLNHPGHPYILALLNGTSVPDADNADTYKEVPPGEPPSLVNPPEGCRFNPRCAKMIAGLCDIEEPAEFEPKSGHLVKCWLFK
jgi:peptide/nickel transport system ATP-binding protein